MSNKTLDLNQPPKGMPELLYDPESNYWAVNGKKNGSSIGKVKKVTIFTNPEDAIEYALKVSGPDWVWDERPPITITIGEALRAAAAWGAKVLSVVEKKGSDWIEVKSFEVL